MYKSFDELPLTLNAADIAAILGISRAGAYELLRSESFPTIRIGIRRLLVGKDRFIEWMNKQADKVTA
jgi:predicted DNA-binding transcriptional regulator AlpA